MVQSKVSGSMDMFLDENSNRILQKIVIIYWETILLKQYCKVLLTEIKLFQSKNVRRRKVRRVKPSPRSHRKRKRKRRRKTRRRRRRNGENLSFPAILGYIFAQVTQLHSTSLEIVQIATAQLSCAAINQHQRRKNHRSRRIPSSRLLRSTPARSQTCRPTGSSCAAGETTIESGTTLGRTERGNVTGTLRSLIVEGMQRGFGVTIFQAQHHHYICT